MIWIVFGAMALAGFLAVGRLAIRANPARARKPLRFASVACWIVGVAMALSGKVALGLLLMAVGAFAIGALGPARSGARVGQKDQRRGAPGGGPDFERDPNAGGGGGRVRPRSGVMTEEEAYQILGLQPGASAEEIGRAHRTLMKKVHPDQGGSTDLAARVNAAKDILSTREHR